MTAKELRLLINKEEVDINDQELFLKAVLGGAIYLLNDNIKLRNKRVPHFFINTGDDILYRELLQYSFDPTYLTTTGEDFVYNECPRCLLDFEGLSIDTGQLTQPFIPGHCVITSPDNDEYEFVAEFRRNPISLSLSLKYVIDSFGDSLRLQQLILTKLSFIRLYRVSYLGQTIECALSFPEGINIQKSTEMSFGTEKRERIIEIDLDIKSNIPVYNNKTAVEASNIISGHINKIIT